MQFSPARTLRAGAHGSTVKMDNEASVHGHRAEPLARGSSLVDGIFAFVSNEFGALPAQSRCTSTQVDHLSREGPPQTVVGVEITALSLSLPPSQQVSCGADDHGQRAAAIHFLGISPTGFECARRVQHFLLKDCDSRCWSLCV